MFESLTESEQVQFTSQASMGDIVWSTVTVVRASGFVIATGTAMLVIGAASILVGAGLLLAVPTAAGGLAFVTGLIGVPVAWMAVRRRREDLLAPTKIRANAERIWLESAGNSSSLQWSLFSSARETQRAFLLDPSNGVVILVAKRGVAGADLESFRGVLTRAGLLRNAPIWRRFLRGAVPVAIGLTVAIALTALPFAADVLQTNARIELSSSVRDGIATVVGSTDLPDGTLISVDVYQADEWRRHGEEGQPADVETFPWIDGEDVTVNDGAFRAAIDVGGWPAGSGGAIALFWVDPAQPDAVRERFGEDGAELRGPHVDEFADGTPRLRVHTEFEIP